MARINVCALSLTLALTYAVLMGLIGLAVAWTGYGQKAMRMYSDLLPGYEPTVRGSFIGGLYGALMGGAMGLIIGGLYNLLAGLMPERY